MKESGKTMIGVQLEDFTIDIDDLPSAPPIILQIIRIRNNPDSSIDDLINVVTLDPAISAKLVKVARSINITNVEINDVESAVRLVLGFEESVNIALASNVFATVSSDNERGLLGAKNLWRHSVFLGKLCFELARIEPFHHNNIDPSVAYLCGLLHDVGHIALICQVPDAYHDLTKRLDEGCTCAKQCSIPDLEQSVYETDHCRLGELLMTKWNMPEEVIITCREHHQFGVPRTLQEFYPMLVHLAEAALRELKAEGCHLDDFPDEVFDLLGINRQDFLKLTSKTIDTVEFQISKL
jgi:HD-like signal output (HDOD) protein